MTKTEAAEFLGCSPRQLERYTSENRIGVRYEKGRTRPTPVYDEAELREFKEALERPLHRPAVERMAAPDTMPTSSDNALALLSQASQLEGLARFIGEAVAAARPAEAPEPTLADIAVKPLLKLDEAQRLTGLSREVLRAAILGGELKAQQIGRAWRIKRADLDSYIAKL